MFADSLYDSGWANRSHRGWTTLTSFTLQALALGAVLASPLIYTQDLPRLMLSAAVVAPAPPPAAPPALLHNNPSAASESNMIGLRLMSPGRIPQVVNTLTETEPLAPAVDPNTFGVAHGIGDSRGSGDRIASIIGSYRPAAPPPPVATHRPPSHMMEGNLIYRVQPRYPLLAIQTRTQGTVLLRAVISKQGTIENLQLISGHPLLVPAAMDAVRQWRYRPYVLNDEPVEVETEVTVKFVLSGG